jgi:hypothetical protein
MFAVIYSAFLLGQAEGRDMWQTPLLPFQLLSQSFMVASGVFLTLGLFVNSHRLFNFLAVLFPASLGIQFGHYAGWQICHALCLRSRHARLIEK